MGFEPPVTAFVVKRLASRYMREEEARADLRAEAEILGALAGRGAPKLVDHGADEHGPFLKMEHVAHATLHTQIHTSTRSPAAHAQWLERASRAAFETLARVHDAEDETGPLLVVHGDISPSNIAIAESGDEAILLDFGLAAGRAWPRRAGGAFRGTARYAAPEVARSEPFDARADLFALAASLLHAAAGTPPRTRSPLAAAIAEAAETPLEPWAARAASTLAPNVAAVLVRCVAFEPGDRPRTASEALAIMW